MKNRILLSTLFVALCLSEISARSLTPQEALLRATASSDIPLPVSSTRSGLQHEMTIGNLYVFGGNNSYVILPSDDRAPAVLAYSDNNSFSAESNPALDYWLDFYNKEIEFMTQSAGTRSDLPAKAERKEKEPIAPLTMTKWNQEGPYNELCPKVNGRGTVTGCVATAMAQVLKYHSYPAKGFGEHSYYWEPGNRTLSFDYGATTFEWDQMTDTYNDDSTEEAKNAVATLMLACGISVDMHYDVGDSGASSMTMGASLIDYFGYNKGIVMPMRDYYGLYEWEDMIYADLEKGLPVLYSGDGTAGGHQFICDGYSSDGFFHFNWGWGGMSNGYYRLTALNPADLGVGGGAGGFNSGQQIALGVKPDSGDDHPSYLMYCTSNFTTATREIREGQQLKFKGGFFNYSLSSLPTDSKIGVKILNTATDKATFEVGYGISELPPLRGYEEIFFRFPDLEDGDYVISPAFYDGKNWNEIKAPVGATGSCKAEVNDGVATLIPQQVSTVSVAEITVPEIIYKGRQFPLEFTVINESDAEFLGDVTPVLVDSQTGKTMATSQYRPVDVEAHSRLRITDYIGKFSTEAGEDLEPGEYLLLFHNHEGKSISEAVKVKIEPSPGDGTIKVSGFELDETDPVTDKSAVKFTFAVTCEEGYFTGRIHIYIFPGDYGRDVAGANSEMYYIEAGEKHYGSIIMDLSSLADGEYIAVLYHNGEECSRQIRFKLSDNGAGISVTEDDKNGNQVIYDLSGKLRVAPLEPGVYIINGKKTLVR